MRVTFQDQVPIEPLKKALDIIIDSIDPEKIILFGSHTTGRSDETLDQIKSILIDVYQPMTVYLYGSYAWGNPTKDSDIDIAVIVKQSEDKVHKRIQKGSLALWKIKYPIDLMVYTQEEFENHLQYPSTLPYKIHKKGIIIYETP